MKILGIGNAIVDVLCKVTDEFLIKHSLTKSTMKLVDEIEFKNFVKNQPITGICGSGIIEAIAEMRINGILDKSGLIGSSIETGSKRSITDGRTYSYLLYEDKKNGENKIKITNADVRAIQLAKAALFAGSRLLMDEMKIKKVDKIVLAGAFGAHISTKHAMVLGMIPDCNLKNVISAGNAAGAGAIIALLNKNSRSKISTIVKKINKFSCDIEIQDGKKV